MEKEFDTTKLELEQSKLAKEVKLTGIKPDEAKLVAGCEVTTLGNQVICSISVLDENFELIEEKFSAARAKFPYLSAFRAFRELPAMLECWDKLENSPDVIIVNGHGINHPRRLGLASHFGIIISKPTIGLSSELLSGEVKAGKVVQDGKIVGEELTTKQGSRPVYISPGNMISLADAVKIVKKFLREPHKLPEPLDAAHKYANQIKDELNTQSKA